MAYRTVCISHVTAAGGETVGKLVAARLGFRYVDDEVIALAAERAHVDPTVLLTAEHQAGLLTRLVDSLMDMIVARPAEVHGYFPREQEPAAYYPPDVLPSTVPPAEEARQVIQDAVVEIARRGQVVIVAHAASLALAGHANVLRVHVTASVRTRVRRVSLRNTLITEEDHAKVVAESDRYRQKYLARFYGVDHELPTHYDLVINTDALELERAAAAVIAVATA